MADNTFPDDDLLPSPLASHPPGTMGEPPLLSPQPVRRITASDDQAPTCRICRSEGSSDEPLFYPCKCSGSIKFVHQECLMEWLSHSHKKHCELCKTPFRFTKLYDADMPPKLPWAVFLRRACVHMALSIGRGFRGLLVGAIWLVMLPWMIRWAWRWMLWIADAGWARDEFTYRYFNQGTATTATAQYTMGLLDIFGLGTLLGDSLPARNASSFHDFKEPDTSILSSWTYISELTPNASMNRVILDIFEGQLITCVVITGFILVFLIREWVVQQQPLVNLENIGNAQQQLREAAERVQADNDRLRRQQELLDMARRRLLELQNEAESMRDTAKEDDDEGRPRSQSDPDADQPSHDVLSQPADTENPQAVRRPPMPERDFSSRATQIQRLLEEAEGVFSPAQAAANADVLRRFAADVSVASAGEPPVSSPVGDLGDSQAASALTEGTATEEIPITNAGPDAKSNIRRSGKGKVRAVPPPKEGGGKVITDAALKKRLQEDEALKRLEDEIRAEDLAGESVDGTAEAANPAGSTDNTGHPVDNDNHERHADVIAEGNPRPQDESISARVASVFREEFGLDEADEIEDLRQMGLGPDGEDATNDGNTEDPPVRPADIPPSYLDRLADWFWGDVQAEATLEPVPAPNEERVEGADGAQQEARFVPVINAQPALPAELLDPQADNGDRENDGHDEGHADPEVVAAAQAAGLDAEAIEDAEDLEGIFELIGLQGPLIGLFQTSTFCTVLVTGTVFGAVGLPYLWGKLVLSFLASPMWFMIQMPLQVASFITDFILDLTLLIGGWSTFITALAIDFLFSGLETWVPKLSEVRVSDWIADAATATAKASGARLQDLFVTTESAENVQLGWNWAFLWASMHSHASLKEIEGEIQATLDYVGSTITAIVETISSGSFSVVWQRLIGLVSEIPGIPVKVISIAQALWAYCRPLLDVINGLRTGALTFQTPATQPFDATLAYWTSTDRFLAVLTGYLALALIAAVYVAIDAPLTRSEAGRKTEKLVRDTLRQAGGVLKVILIISIEMLVFPLYCGLLLDLAFLPLFRDASVATRWHWAGERPYLFCFVHWFVGTCYMFHFALFVGMCRKILRKGVLWFIRDPDDPTFHPVRDVLERNVTTQLRKIAFSALVYGALVILCLGGVIWTIGRVFKGIFPIHWVSTEPVLEFPVDLLLYNAITPLVIRLFRPSDAVNAMYAWWLRRCARILRLSHFLFDDRRRDEEGRHERKSWSSFLLMRTAKLDEKGRPTITETDDSPDVSFHHDGKYVLTPCSDQYRPPKAGEAFLHTTPPSTSDVQDYDVYVADKDGKKNDHFAKVYIPPFFRLRVTLFMVCLWMFSAFTGLCTTLVPLCFGRTVLASFLPQGIRVNDIYAYSAGAYILGGAVFLILRGRSRLSQFKAPTVDVKAYVEPTKQFAIKTMKCLYVYGFIGIVLPLVFALVLQFYLIMPLHTWASSVIPAAGSNSPQNTAMTLATNMTQTGATFIQNTLHPSQQSKSPMAGRLAKHTIHILQDYCLGLLYVRVVTRSIITTPSSRAAKAFRRITEDGYLNPNIRLATRFLVLPVSVLSIIALLGPGLLARAALSTVETTFGNGTLSAEDITKVYRYSYPLAASWFIVLLFGMQFSKATARWRQSIRDEVYLVGERLHNFGEKRPPAGSRSVVRKER